MALSKFIKTQKKLYKSLKSCHCPALQETVHFTADGLNHLLYYRRRPRKHNEKHYRAGLISHLKDVIENATKTVKTIELNNPLTTTWELNRLCKVNGDNHIVKVVLIKRGAGNVKFLSAMSRKKYKKTKKPKKKS